MRNWKKAIVAALALSMAMPSCLPQTLWAAEFSDENTAEFAEDSVEGSTADAGFTIEDVEEAEDSEISQDEDISSGELDMTDGTLDADSAEPEVDVELDMTDDALDAAGEVQTVENYVVQLYSDGKVVKTYTIPSAELQTAKAPAALSKSGYTFKEWNTQADGKGTAYKPGDPIQKLLEESTVTQIQEADQQDNVQVSIQSDDSEMDADPELDVQALDPETAEADAQTDLEIEEIPDAAGDTAGNTVALYAVWQKNVSYTITYKLNGGQNNKANPKNYTVESQITLKNATRSGYHFVGWYRDSKFKNKVTSIAKGSKGALTLYAKWTIQVNPSAKASTLNSIRGQKAGVIAATATVPKYVKSYDDYYYLVYVDSNSGKVKRAAAKVKKPEVANQKITMSLKTAGHPEYVQGKFAIAVKNSKTTWCVISSRSYVSNPENLSSNKKAYYMPKTKKGLQTGDINQLTATNSKTAFMNLFPSDVMTGDELFVYNGKKYYFSKLYGLDAYVRNCNAKGIQVTIQINLTKTSSTSGLTVSGSASDTAYYGWNTTNANARQTMEAMFAYLGQKFGANDCYVSNWILGNEINSASRYYYVGNVSFSKYISMYSEAFRCLYNAVRSGRSSSKVFICLDNCWGQKNIFKISYSAKSTLDTFASTVSRLQKGVNWNLAYHAYSQPLTESQFWAAKANPALFSSDANKASFITMYNIQALTNYVKTTFGSKTRIILSEQGFSSKPGGQANQAASIALAYYKAACNPMIDAFIIRCYQDNEPELKMKLELGLKTLSGKNKTAYNVFKTMDNSSTLKYATNVLNSQVGKNWKSKVPGYNTKRIAGMYRAE